MSAKTYTPTFLGRTLISAIGLFLISLPFLGIFVIPIKIGLSQIIATLILIPGGFFGLELAWLHKVIINEKEITSLPYNFLPNTGTLRWDEIVGIKTPSLEGFFPEASPLELVPSKDSGKKSILVSLWGMPIEMTADILAHIRPGTKVTLNYYIEHELKKLAKKKERRGLKV